MSAPDGNGAAEGGALPDDVVADLLGSERRRYVLETLSRRETAMVVDDLAATVRAREVGTSPEAVGPDERRRVREDLYQRHLPKLTATGVVRHDSVLGTVELTDPHAFAEDLGKR